MDENEKKKIKEIKHCIREFLDGYYDKSVETGLIEFLDDLVRRVEDCENSQSGLNNGT